MKTKRSLIVAGIIALIIIAAMVYLMVDTQAIIDFLTPKINEEKELFYLFMTLGGAVILILILKHTKPKTWNKKKN